MKWRVCVSIAFRTPETQERAARLLYKAELGGGA